MDPYKVLGVSSDADFATIERAFKKLSLKMHPDKANAATVPPGVETKTEKEIRERRNHNRFVELTNARDTLINAKNDGTDELRPEWSTTQSEFSKFSRTSHPSHKHGARTSSSSRSHGNRTSRPGLNDFDIKNLADNLTGGRMSKLEDMDSEILSLKSELFKMQDKLRPTEERPGKYDMEFVDLSYSFTCAIRWNLDLAAVIGKTKGRMVDHVTMKSPMHGRFLEDDVDTMITQTRSHIRRERAFVDELKRAFNSPSPRSQLCAVFNRFREQWSET